LSAAGRTDVEQKKTLIALIALQCIYVAFSPFWLYFATVSTMIFDNPETANDPWIFLFFVLNLMYPTGLLAGMIVSWVLFARGRWAAAWKWNLIPLLWVVPIGSFFFYAFLR